MSSNARSGLIVDAAEVTVWDAEADVIVVGAGGCGLVAALAAGEGGATVFLLDRDRKPTCNTARSGGMIPAAATRLQQAAGIDEAAEGMLADILAKNHGTSDPALTLHLCRTATDVVNWLTEIHHLELELATDFLYPGHTQFRMHSPPQRTGGALVADLKRAVSDVLAIEYVPDMNVVGLVADAHRAVGVKTAGGEHLRAGKVILACNGFAGNPELVRRHIPLVSDALYFGGPASTGEGILWGQALGGDVAYMDAYQCHATVAMPGEILVSYSVTMEGGFHVNLAGDRFAREDRGYSEHALDVLAQPEGIAWVIYDARIHTLGLTFPDYRDCVAAGLVKDAPDLGALAERCSLPADRLQASFDGYQAGRAAGADRFGRTTFADLRPPYHAVRVTGALFHTQGGLRVDEHARVLRSDGMPVPDLYAGGGTAAGISGHGPEGYFSGNGLLTATGYGYLAGRHAVASLRKEARGR